ncbi:LOW QUALITY PROTEIN: activating signal cointegrator 1 complex subunit 2-like [Mercenaria mercenaria]|uniref:LOW QUALITY PROTEIN: activating signal cointegrator 1 complex subunit 2-like n=1 Tax=Mercenaria mercenaria TaxID=6596 RepID=UPI00234F4042|nr:LOW QUALITY PROTEIN: activating signal cointegrator 1 complex subunit 2-like [Mercenaria mercenaria]
MSVPLDKLHVIVESGKSKQTVAALDPRWMEQVQFVSYQAPPKDLSDKGQYEAWLERIKFIEDDLHWLLQLPHNKFWCQAIFDETLHRCIDSYLRFAPRSYNVLQELPEHAREKHNEVHRLVFMTCVRMSTFKESKECYITPSVFGEILYENFIFDIPKLLDLCVLYGQGNGALLAKMIENIFTKQPKYNEDLAQTISTLSQVFDSVMEKCGIKFDSGSHSPQKLSDHGKKTPLHTRDETRLQYIQDAVNSAFSTYGKRKSPKGAMKRGGRQSPEGSSGETVGAVGGGKTSSAVSVAVSSVPTDIYQVEDSDAVGACAPQVTGVELESMVSSVKDLLPELGEGFIELCLEELNYDIERVINAVLEDRLPPSLQQVDRTMPRKKRAITPPSVLHERKNVYDFDEFDVFHRDDIDKQKIRKGKLGKTENVSIGDQSELKDIKSAISKDYGVIQEVVIDDGGDKYTRDMYDDEYDDTYDVNAVGADDADSADELTTVRPFTTPRVLGGQTKADRKDHSESEESDEDANAANRDNFIEDPAVIRQRAEERARWKAGRAKPSQAPKTHDVKGGPKGQGQSAEVLRNRRWKTQHKGDHRRAAADKKRKV